MPFDGAAASLAGSGERVTVGLPDGAVGSLVSACSGNVAAPSDGAFVESSCEGDGVGGDEVELACGLASVSFFVAAVSSAGTAVTLLAAIATCNQRAASVLGQSTLSIL